MKLAVIQGGPSSEAEVSRASARCVTEALEAKSHSVTRLELGPGLPASLLSLAPDVVFPAVHGTQGEDGCLQGLLEVLLLPYVGSEVRGSALAADKVASKQFYRLAGLDVARERLLSSKSLSSGPGPLLASLRRDLGERIIMKPAHGGSTLGIVRILEGEGEDEFTAALREVLRHDSQVLVEELISGKEYTCSVVDEGEQPQALPVTYIQSRSTDWLDFESKYASGGSLHECPALIEASLTSLIQQASLVAHKALGLRDLSRSDFIVDNRGRAIILESNTLPGMTSRSLLPEAVRAGGRAFGDVLDALVKKAKKRGCVDFRGAEPLPAS